MKCLISYVLVPFLAWVTDEQAYENKINPPPAPVEGSAGRGQKVGLANTPGENPKQKSESEANQQAIYWLKLIDGGQYPASWLACGGLLRDVVSQDQWSYAMQMQRRNLGNVQSRKVTSKQAIKQLPYGTRGNFMEISYDTSFGQKPNATEVVTLITEGRLNQWKVVSYIIK